MAPAAARSPDRPCYPAAPTAGNPHHPGDLAALRRRRPAHEAPPTAGNLRHPGHCVDLAAQCPRRPAHETPPTAGNLRHPGHCVDLAAQWPHRPGHAAPHHDCRSCRGPASPHPPQAAAVAPRTDDPPAQRRRPPRRAAAFQDAYRPSCCPSRRCPHPRPCGKPAARQLPRCPDRAGARAVARRARRAPAGSNHAHGPGQTLTAAPRLPRFPKHAEPGTGAHQPPHALPGQPHRPGRVHRPSEAHRHARSPDAQRRRAQPRRWPAGQRTPAVPGTRPVPGRRSSARNPAPRHSPRAARTSLQSLFLRHYRPALPRTPPGAGRWVDLAAEFCWRPGYPPGGPSPDLSEAGHTSSEGRLRRTEGGPHSRCPAASYSPTRSPAQYHRR